MIGKMLTKMKIQKAVQSHKNSRTFPELGICKITRNQSCLQTHLGICSR